MSVIEVVWQRVIGSVKPLLYGYFKAILRLCLGSLNIALRMACCALCGRWGEALGEIKASRLTPGSLARLVAEARELSTHASTVNA